MADFTITIDASGDPHPSSLYVNHNDKVKWEADDTTKTWYITFSPFKVHVIETDANGDTPYHEACRGVGKCAYQISDSDPKLLAVGRVGILTGGGGIIIDN